MWFLWLILAVSQYLYNFLLFPLFSLNISTIFPSFLLPFLLLFFFSFTISTVFSSFFFLLILLLSILLHFSHPFFLSSHSYSSFSYYVLIISYMFPSLVVNISTVFSSFFPLFLFLSFFSSQNINNFLYIFLSS